MNAVRRRKLFFYSAMVLVLAGVSLLMMYALKQNISLFYTPADAASGQAAGKQSIRLGGMVVKNSVKRHQDLQVEFALTDFNSTIWVSYRGILPDLFREGQGIVARGRMLDNSHFEAVEVLAKHDAEYMPPEVKAALKEAVDRKATLKESHS